MKTTYARWTTLACFLSAALGCAAQTNFASSPSWLSAGPVQPSMAYSNALLNAIPDLADQILPPVGLTPAGAPGLDGLVGPLGSGPRCAQAPAGLVAWWQGEGNASDAMLQDNGTLYGNVGFLAGEVGDAFSFDGATSYVAVSNSPVLLLTNQLTIEFWVQRRNLSSEDYIINKGGDYTWNALNYGITLNSSLWGSRVVFTFAGGYRRSVSIADYNWHHIAVVAINGQTNPTFYVDGVQQSVADGYGPVINLYPSTQPLHIGAQIDPQSGWYYYSSALVDEVSIYNTALSATNIQAIYNAGVAGKCPETAPSIVTQPQSQRAALGRSATFNALAQGSSPLSYQWRFNGTPLANATASALVLNNLQLGESGSYSLLVTNPWGWAVSANAVLEVYNPVCVPPAAGLVAWWAAEDNPYDVLGQHSGTNHGGVAFLPGEVGEAFSFNGTNSYVEVGDASTLELTSQLTIEFWAQRRNFVIEDYIVNKGGDYTRGALNYGVTLNSSQYGGKLAFTFAWGYRRSVSIADTNWHHIAVVARNGDANPTFYVDGEQQPVTDSGGAATINLYPSTEPLYLGAQVDSISGWYYYSSALVDEVSLYNTALNAYQIRAIYQAGVAGKCSGPPPDNMVIAWGDDSFGKCDVPAGLSNVVAVAGGNDHSLALRSDGTVLGWGHNNYGQATGAAGLTNVVRIAASWDQSAAVLANGTVTNWGHTNGTIPNLTNAVAISAGAYYVLALLGDGNLVSWGDTNQAGSTVPPGLSQVRAIASGWNHNLALLPDRTVTIWGSYGGAPTNVPAGLSNVTAIAAAGDHSLALRFDGTVVAWGDNTYGQTNVPPGLSNVVAIAAGVTVSLAMTTDGSVVAWGPQDPELLGPLPEGLGPVMGMSGGLYHALAVRAAALPPVILQPPANAAQISGGSATFSVNAVGLAPITYQWQFNGTNIAGATNSSLTLSAVSATNSGNYSVIATTSWGSTTSSPATFTLITPPTIVPSQRQWVGYLSNATLTVTANAPAQWAAPLSYQWQFAGTNLIGQISSNYTILRASFANDGNYTVVVSNLAGSTNAVVPLSVLVPGRTVGWGADDQGQSDCPAALTNTLSVAAGLSHTLALSEDGTVAAWGDNSYGQTSVPPGLTNVTAIACGSGHSLALRADGTVAAWGDNALGETNVPSGLTNAVAVAAGWCHNLALLKSGGVTNWGKSIGATPSNLTNVTAISAGLDFSLALRADATVVAWGTNSYGQTNVPAGLTGVVAISAGATHSLALKRDGTVAAWGDNSLGEATVPTGLSNVMAVAGGMSFSTALRNDGTVLAWGNNTYGQTNVIAGLSQVKSIAAGGNHAVAALFSPWVEYPVNVTNDLLLVYNSNSSDSSNLCAYYLAHRPMVSNANVLAVACDAGEFITSNNCDAQIVGPVLSWLNNNPTKHPQYLLLFFDMPTRITNYSDSYPSVTYRLYSQYPGTPAFMNYINAGTLADCKAYVDKLAYFGTNFSPGKVLISASSHRYGNTNYALDNVRHGSGYPDDETGGGATVSTATNGLLANGVLPGAIIYYDGVETRTNGIPTNLPHLTNATNVAGYICWGEHSSLGQTYAVDGTVKWGTNSAWWIIETIESFNGQRQQVSPMGNFIQWFSTNAFGGTNYSNTPVGAATHVEEPYGGVETSAVYLGLWAAGKNFSICAWNARNTPYFQAVGDPFVTH